MLYSELTYHMAYRTKYSKIVWQEVLGRKVYWAMKIGYLLVNVKIWITLLFLCSLLAGIWSTELSDFVA